MENKKKMKKLNIGSGREVLEGWDNLDNHGDFGANILLNLKNLPLQIKDNTYDLIKCTNVLEHFIDVVPLIDEFVRITKLGGKIEIIVPYRDCVWDSIDYKKQFVVNTFYDYLKQYDFGLSFAKDVKIENIEFYSKNPKVWVRFKVWFFTKLLKINKSIIDYTFLKNYSYGLSIKCTYKKNSK